MVGLCQKKVDKKSKKQTLAGQEGREAPLSEESKGQAAKIIENSPRPWSGKQWKQFKSDLRNQ